MTSRCGRRWERRCSSVWWPWPTARLPGMSAGLLEQQLAALSRPLLLGVRTPQCCCTRCAQRMRMVAAAGARSLGLDPTLGGGASPPVPPHGRPR